MHSTRTCAEQSTGCVRGNTAEAGRVLDGEVHGARGARQLLHVASAHAVLRENVAIGAVELRVEAPHRAPARMHCGSER